MATTASSLRIRTVEAPGSGELEVDEDHEADEGEGFGEGDAEEHRGPDHAGGLGLAGHRLDRLADEVADADAGADGGQAVAETGRDGLAELDEVGTAVGGCCEHAHGCLVSPVGCSSRTAQCSGCMAPPMYTAARIVKM